MTSHTEPQSILVYVGGHADNAIGENLIKMPFLVALRELYPAARLSWIPGVGPAQFDGILKRLAGGMVDELITDLDIPQDALEPLRLRRPLPDHHFDLVIDTQRVVARTLAMRRVPHNVFISGNWNFFFSDRKPPAATPKPTKLIDKLMILLSAARGEPVTAPHLIPVPDEEMAAAETLLPNGPAYVGLAPGAGRRDTGKLWPLERYITVALDQVAKGRTPVFILGPDEANWLDQVNGQVPGALTPLNGPLPDGVPLTPALTVALGRRLAVAVANCSGTGHMLAGGGAPMVSLYAPTDPAKYAPHSPRVTALRAQDFGGAAIEAIPTGAVTAAVDVQVAVPR